MCMLDIACVCVAHKLAHAPMRPRSEVGRVVCNNIIAVILEFGDGYG